MVIYGADKYASSLDNCEFNIVAYEKSFIFFELENCFEEFKIVRSYHDVKYYRCLDDQCSTVEEVGTN